MAHNIYSKARDLDEILSVSSGKVQTVQDWSGGSAFRHTQLPHDDQDGCSSSCHQIIMSARQAMESEKEEM